MKTFKYGSLSVVCDPSQVFPNDPGAGTPAMVFHKNGACATLWCAMGEGELDHARKGMYRLTDKQVNWLESIEPEVVEFLYTKEVCSG